MIFFFLPYVLLILLLVGIPDELADSIPASSACMVDLILIWIVYRYRFLADTGRVVYIPYRYVDNGAGRPNCHPPITRRLQSDLVLYPDHRSSISQVLAPDLVIET